jgi:hypothetical protein
MRRLWHMCFEVFIVFSSFSYFDNFVFSLDHCDNVLEPWNIFNPKIEGAETTKENIERNSVTKAIPTPLTFFSTINAGVETNPNSQTKL